MGLALLAPLVESVGCKSNHVGIDGRTLQWDVALAGVAQTL